VRDIGDVDVTRDRDKVQRFKSGSLHRVHVA
jgi:hypothetical protein